jgi:hypothetical protein
MRFMEDFEIFEICNNSEILLCNGDCFVRTGRPENVNP